MTHARAETYTPSQVCLAVQHARIGPKTAPRATGLDGTIVTVWTAPSGIFMMSSLLSVVWLCRLPRSCQLRLAPAEPVEGDTSLIHVWYSVCGSGNVRS